EGIIEANDAQVLGQAYDRLRVIEHRLQMVHDRQTHALPESVADLDNVARLDGLEDGQALVAELTALCRTVAERYDRLLGEGDAPAPDRSDIDPDLRDKVRQRARHWRESIRSLRGVEARAALDAMLPDLVEALARAPEPDTAL